MLSSRKQCFEWVDHRKKRRSFYTYVAFTDQTETEYDEDVTEYKQLVNVLKERNLGEGVSLKLQQFGNTKEDQRRRLEDVVRHCRSKEIRCILSAFLPDERRYELETYLSLKKTYSGPVLGLCLAADANDWQDQIEAVAHVMACGGWIRWVKGGWYKGKTSVSHWKLISKRFAAMSLVLMYHSVECNRGHMIATHDKRVVSLLKDNTPSEKDGITILVSYGTYRIRPSDDAEVGMFYGKHVPFVLESLRVASLTNLFLRVTHLRLIGVPRPTVANLKEDVQEVMRTMMKYPTLNAWLKRSELNRIFSDSSRL